MNLTKSAAQAADAGIGDAIPYLVLVALVVVTGFVQQRQTMRNQTTPNPQMAIIGKVFPIVFAFISWSLPSGVVLYFATSNLWQMGQQEYVFRTIGSAEGPPPKKRRAELEGSSEPDEKGSGATTTKDKPAGGAAEEAAIAGCAVWSDVGVRGRCRQETWCQGHRRQGPRGQAGRRRPGPEQPKAEAIDGVGTDDGPHRRGGVGLGAR